MGNVFFKAGSSRNISFNEFDDSGYTEKEWGELTRSEQDTAVMEYVWEILDVATTNEEGEYLDY